MISAWMKGVLVTTVTGDSVERCLQIEPCSTCRIKGQEVERKESAMASKSGKPGPSWKNDRDADVQLPCFLADVQTAGLLVGGHCHSEPHSAHSSGLWDQAVARVNWGMIQPSCIGIKCLIVQRVLCSAQKQSPSSYVQKNFVIFPKALFLVTLILK